MLAACNSRTHQYFNVTQTLWRAACPLHYHLLKPSNRPILRNAYSTTSPPQTEHILLLHARSKGAPCAKEALKREFTTQSASKDILSLSFYPGWYLLGRWQTDKRKKRHWSRVTDSLCIGNVFWLEFWAEILYLIHRQSLKNWGRCMCGCIHVYINIRQKWKLHLTLHFSLFVWVLL
jgi:hypothetical protein